MDEFSFPTVAAPDSVRHLPFPHFATSPLWFVQHHRRSHSSDDDAYYRIDDNVDSPPLSGDGGVDGDRFVDKEERMDMLWEDFNEELYRASRNGGEGGARGANGEAPEAESDPDDKHGAVEFCCVQALGSSEGGGGLVHHRRPSLGMMLKVLKKLFLIQKTSSSRRASSLMPSTVQTGMQAL